MKLLKNEFKRFRRSVHFPIRFLVDCIYLVGFWCNLHTCNHDHNHHKLMEKSPSEISVTVRSGTKKDITVLSPSLDFKRAYRISTPRVWWGVKRAVSPLSTTACAKSSFSGYNLDTLHRVTKHNLFHFQTPITVLTTGRSLLSEQH